MRRSRGARRGRSTRGAGSTSTSGRARPRSMPAPPRYNGTSSPSGSWVSRGSRRGGKFPDHRRLDAVLDRHAARREPRGRERLPQLRHELGLPPRHGRGTDGRGHGPERRADRADGGRQRRGGAGTEPLSRPNLRGVPRRSPPHHEGGARARSLRAELRLHGAPHRALNVEECPDRSELLAPIRDGGRARRDLPDPGGPYGSPLPVGDRTAYLHRRGGPRLPGAAHRLRAYRVAVDGGDDRRRLEAPERLDRHLGARAEALPTGVRSLLEDLRSGQGLLRDRLPAASVGAGVEGGGGAGAARGGHAALPARQRREGVQPDSSFSLMEASPPEYLARTRWPPAPRRRC